MAITTSGTTITFNDATTQTTGAYFFPVGTAMLFQQTAAPTGWTKVTTYNDYAIRIVSGAASTGGSVAFTTAFASKAVTGTNSGGSVSATSLSTAQLAAHSHNFGCNSNYQVWGATVSGGSGYGVPVQCGSGYSSGSFNRDSNNTGSGSSHTHGFTQPTFTGTAINLAVQYVDHIIATKN
jgi:hypothetical protein